MEKAKDLSRESGFSHLQTRRHTTVGLYHVSTTEMKDDPIWDLHLSRKWATRLGVKLALYLVESKGHGHQLPLVKHLHKETLVLILFLHATQQNVSLSVKIQEHA